MSEKKDQLHTQATKARNHAYSPYSHHKIGAAVLLDNGYIYSGCNVENASYGGTICAERTAVVKAVSETQAPIKIEEICVVSDAREPWPPCGFCRQVIAEFATPETKIHVGNLDGIKKTYKLKELLPEAFGPNFLKKY